MPSSVSIVIPCYRQAHLLGDALESAFAQTLPAAEVIVVDDGSPDDVPAVVARYPGARCLSQKNAGLGAARNAGLAACTGEFVVFLDADDRLLPNALEAGVRALEDQPDGGLVWGLRYLIDMAGRRLPPDYPRPPATRNYLSLLTRNYIGPPVGVMFRRSVLDAVGGFWTSRLPVEDYDLYLRIARHHPIVFHGVHVGEYRRHAGNMSSDYERMVLGRLEVLRRQEVAVGDDTAARQAIGRARQQALRGQDRFRRLEQVKGHADKGEWGMAMGAAAGLFSRHPGALLPVVRAAVNRLRRN